MRSAARAVAFFRSHAEDDKRPININLDTEFNTAEFASFQQLLEAPQLTSSTPIPKDSLPEKKVENKLESLRETIVALLKGYANGRSWSKHHRPRARLIIDQIESANDITKIRDILIANIIDLGNKTTPSSYIPRDAAESKEVKMPPSATSKVNLFKSVDEYTNPRGGKFLDILLEAQLCLPSDESMALRRSR